MQVCKARAVFSGRPQAPRVGQLWPITDHSFSQLGKSAFCRETNESPKPWTPTGENRKGPIADEFACAPSIRTYTSGMTKQTEEARAVATDQELTEGVFRLGSKYYVRTPTYAYVGVLEAVTPMVYVFARGSSTVFDTGPYPEFFKGRGGDVQEHTGGFELLIDRAGAVLVRMS